MKITGINDAAVIGGENSGAVTEDATTPTLTDTGTLTITDADTGEASFQTTGITASSGALGSLSITSAGVWTYSVANADVQYLKAGEIKTETFTVLATDGTDHTVTVKITGINDAAVISTGGADDSDTGAVTEDASTPSLTDNDTLSISDDDTDEDKFDTTSVSFKSTTLGGDKALGSLSITEGGTWTYTVANNTTAVQALGAGATIKEVFTVSSLDGSASHDITVVITGVNDVATISGSDSGSVTEDVDLSTSGSLTINDADSGEASFVAQSSSGSYGSFNINTGGGWNYSLSNNLASVQALGVGETLSDSFTVNASDGSPHSVTITIHGTNDAPVTSASSAAATEGGAVISGRVAATDVDGDSLNYSLVGEAPTGLTFNSDGSYSFDPSGEAYDSLREGETLDLLVSYQVDDGHGGLATAILTITVTGTNDAPKVAALPGQSTRENEPLTVVLGEGLFSDVDKGDVLTVSATLGNGDPLPGWLSFDPGSRTFNGTPPVGEAGDLTIVVTVTDSAGASDQGSFALTVDAAPVVVDNQPAAPTVDTPSGDNGGPTNQPDVSIADSPSIPTVQPAGDTFIPLESGVEVNGEIPDTAITEGAGDATIEAGQNFVIEGEGGGQLTFEARLVSGESLPDGVRIDGETGQIFISGGADISELQIVVEARDESGDSAQASFTLTKEPSSDQQIAAQLAQLPATAAGGTAPAEAGTGEGGASAQKAATAAGDQQGASGNQGSANKTLDVDAGIPDQLVQVSDKGSSSFEVPVDAFAFAGENGNLTLEAKQANGDPLPDWVAFDPDTGRFEVDLSRAGDAVLDLEELEIRVIATDGAGNSAFAVFSVRVQQTEGETEPDRAATQEQEEPVAKGGTVEPQADQAAVIKVVQPHPVSTTADLAALAAAAKPSLTAQLQAQGRQAQPQALLDDLAALFTKAG